MNRIEYYRINFIDKHSTPATQHAWHNSKQYKDANLQNTIHDIKWKNITMT